MNKKQFCKTIRILEFDENWQLKGIYGACRAGDFKK